MEVPRLGVESELQLPAYTAATAARGLSFVCDLHCSSWQPRIPDPLSEARDRMHILMDTGRVHFHLNTTGTPSLLKFESRVFKVLTSSKFIYLTVPQFLHL